MAHELVNGLHEAMSLKAKAKIALYVLLSALVCSIILACQEKPDPSKPDYSKAGGYGKLPEGVTKGQRGMEYSIYSPLPSPLACNHTYKLTIGTKQQVPKCENFNFTELYNRAAADRDERVKKLTCPKEECPTLHQRDILRKWGCDELGTGNRLAYVNIQTEVSCLKSTDEKPTGLKPLAADAFKSPFQEPAGGAPLPFQDADELIYEEIGDTVDLACPGSDLVTFVYTEKVETCAIKDFKPYVQRAEERASFYHDLLGCQDACEKQPFKVLRREWECGTSGGESLVHVTVYFQVNCKRKQ
jgi:hypothetical protein